jgi:hypothetical protein
MLSGAGTAMLTFCEPCCIVAHAYVLFGLLLRADCQAYVQSLAPGVRNLLAGGTIRASHLLGRLARSHTSAISCICVSQTNPYALLQLPTVRLDHSQPNSDAVVALQALNGDATAQLRSACSCAATGIEKYAGP